MVSRIRQAQTAGPTRVVVLIHGFNTSAGAARDQYREMAIRIRGKSALLGQRVEVVGLTWPSYPGAPLRWLPRALGYRLTQELGFRNAVKNPYLQQLPSAQLAGRVGLRGLLQRLNQGVPEAAVSLFAHSMGSEVVVRALAPDSLASIAPLPHVEGVVLAGADLDHDAFCSRRDPRVRLALTQARLWWVTIPRENTADAVLELRRGAGRRDALGNVGMELEAPDLHALLDRRGLLIDDQAVPIGHSIEDYYTASRVERVLRSLTYLRSATEPAGRSSLLAQVEQAVRGDETGRQLSTGDTSSLRLYRTWKAEPDREDFGPVRICRKSR